MGSKERNIKNNERETGAYKTNVEKKGEDQTDKHNRNTQNKIMNNHNNTTQERQQETKQDNEQKKRRTKT